MAMSSAAIALSTIIILARGPWRRSALRLVALTRPPVTAFLAGRVAAPAVRAWLFAAAGVRPAVARVGESAVLAARRMVAIVLRMGTWLQREWESGFGF